MFIRKVVLLMVVLYLMTSFTVFAQMDTVFVPAALPDGGYYSNSLVEYVAADTNMQGEQLHRVYKLERGKLYLLDEPLEIHNPVELVADPPVPNDPNRKPPKILSNVTNSGEAAAANLINTYADITIKNIWLGGICPDGETRGWGMGQALAVLDSFVTVRMDGVWADYNGWAVFATHLPHTRWYIDHLHARNEQNFGDVWTAFLFYLEGATVVDTFVVKNSTYFQSNSFFLFPPNKVGFVKIDHCTMVNTLKWPFHTRQWRNAHITNNIFYNLGSLSTTDAEEETADPGPVPWGIINTDTLYENEMHFPDPPPVIPERDRIFLVSNNIYFWSAEIQDYWEENDSVKAMNWMNDYTRAMFDDDENYPHFIDENNLNIDPRFDDFPELTECNKLLADVCVGYRSGYFNAWDWDADMQEYPDSYKVEYTYPLPEYFKSYAGVTGTDGEPVGDLSYLDYLPLTVDSHRGNIPAGFELLQNYPNPFNPETSIDYRLDKYGPVTLDVYDVTGRRVVTLVNREQTAGNHRIVWNGLNENGKPAASGLYFYSLRADGQTQTHKMLLVR